MKSKLLKDKQNLILKVIIIILIITLIIVSKLYIQNKNIKDNYKKIYDVQNFQLTELINDSSRKLKKQLDKTLISRKINNDELSYLKQTVDLLNNTYMQLVSNCVNNTIYVSQNSSFDLKISNSNMIIPIQQHIRFLEFRVNSSTNTQGEITIDESEKKYLKEISNFCDDMYKLFENNGFNANGVEAKSKIIESNGWIKILNGIGDIFDKYSNTFKDFPKHSDN